MTSPSEDGWRSLPEPDSVEALDYERILSDCKAELQALEPELDVDALPQSDPLVKILEVLAFRELYIRQNVNEAIRASLALTVDGEDRRSFARQPFHTAGSAAAYEYFARQAAGDALADVRARSVREGTAEVMVLGHHGEPLAPAAFERVVETLKREDIRPITHQVVVRAAQIARFEVRAKLGVFSEPSALEAVATARQRVERYVRAQYRIGATVTREGLIGALSQPAIRYIILDQPEFDIAADPDRSGGAHREAPLLGAPYAAPEDIHVGIDTDPPPPMNDLALVAEFNGPGGAHSLRVRPAEHEFRLTHYALYIGDADGHRIPSQPPLEVIRVGGDNTFFKDGFPDKSEAPPGTASLVVFSANQNGECATPAVIFPEAWGDE